MFGRLLIIGLLMVPLYAFSEPVSTVIGFFDRTADWGGPNYPPLRGVNKVPGSAFFSGGVYHIEGQGDDIWDNTDEGFFLYRNLPGSQAITGRVRWIDIDNQEWSKIGLMMREKGDDPASRHYWFLLRGNLFGDRICPQWRDSIGENSEGTVIHPANNPSGYVTADSDAAIWFRVTRIAEANIVMSEWSYDGQKWNFGHSKSMPFPDTIAWGIAITNHQDNQNVAIAEVENLSIEKPKLIVGSRVLAGPTYFNMDSFFKAGSQFAVTIHLSNISGNLLSEDITEIVPEGWLISDISSGGVENNGTITWPGYSLQAGEKSSVSYQVTVPAKPQSKCVFRGSIGALDILGSDSMTLLGDAIDVFDGHVDVGDVTEPGDVQFNDETKMFEVFGGGKGIGNGVDQFHFLFKRVTGPFVLKGNVDMDLLDSTNDLAKAGLMVRADLSADSPYAFIAIYPGYQHDALWRTEKGGIVSNAGSNADNVGSFEIEKIGDAINLYYISAQTGNKTLCRSLAIPMTVPVYAGFAVTSHQDDALSVGYFQDIEFMEFDGYAARDLATEIAPTGGGNVEGNKVSVHVTEGKASSSFLTEDIPVGFTVKNIKTTNGKASASGNIITWTLSNLSGAADMTYDLIVPALPSGSIATFSGSFAGLPIYGDNKMIPVFFQIPYIDRKTVLDGVISEGEYENAYTETFDHADRIPPGVHWYPDEGEQPREVENAAFHVFHNMDLIQVAIDVTDTNGLDFESGSQVWANDSSELYMDGNLSRSEKKENDRYGFQAIVLGNGLATTGNDAPAMTPLSNGGGASSLGAYWNAGARAKPSNDGYIVEYAVSKSQILDPPSRTIIGFDILINSADGTGERAGKWGYWNTSLGAVQTDLEYWNNEQGWAIVELVAGAPTGLSDWPLF